MIQKTFFKRVNNKQGNRFDVKGADCGPRIKKYGLCFHPSRVIRNPELSFYHPQSLRFVPEVMDREEVQHIKDAPGVIFLDGKVGHC